MNPARNVAAFEPYLELLQRALPGARSGQVDIFQVQELYMQGRVAAAAQWADFAAPVIDPAPSKVAGSTSFGLQPGNIRNGKLDRSANPGGQLFVLTIWNDATVVAESLDLVEWWLSEATQIAAVKAGGRSALNSVIDNSRAPWNAAYRQSMPCQRDLWHLPEIFAMPTRQQDALDHASTGQISA